MATETLTIIGRNIEKYRKKARLSRAELAAMKQVDTSRGVIYEIEVGKKGASIEMLEKIADALSAVLGEEITVRDLLKEPRAVRRNDEEELAVAGGRKRA